MKINIKRLQVGYQMLVSSQISSRNRIVIKVKDYYVYTLTDITRNHGEMLHIVNLRTQLRYWTS